MNVKLTGTEEWKDGKNEGQLGEVFIRYVFPSLVLPLCCFVCTLDCFGGCALLVLRGNAHGRCNNVLWISEGGYGGERMRED